jgi:uncharacterized membrane protein YgdD (TMEM256/DUF423 family)
MSAMNIILLIGAVFGLSSVMMAAYVDHSLAMTLTGKSLNAVQTALRYHQLYAIIISLLGLFSPTFLYRKWLSSAAYVFSLGLLSFSFSIYLTYIWHVSGLLYFTPLGGLLLMLGWVLLIVNAILRTKQQQKNYLK